MAKKEKKVNHFQIFETELNLRQMAHCAGKASATKAGEVCDQIVDVPSQIKDVKNWNLYCPNCQKRLDVSAYEHKVMGFSAPWVK